MKTQIKKKPVTELIDYKYSRLVEPFEFYSEVLGRWCEIPTGFVMDWESVPLLKGTSKIGGLIHDYFSRKDSVPVVTKKVAADVYMEFMIYTGAPARRRYVKYWVVRVAPNYFHKLKVFDSPQKSA